MVPLVLAMVLTLVAVLAAMRGDGHTPTLVSSSELSEQSAATGAGTPTAGDEPAPTTEPATPARVEDLPTSGSGEFVGAPGAPAPVGAAPYRRFAVAVETGIGLDVDELAAFVDTVLADERSWIGDGVTGFERVGSDQPVDFIIVVATPATVDRLCAPL